MNIPHIYSMMKMLTIIYTFVNKIYIYIYYYFYLIFG